MPDVIAALMRERPMLLDGGLGTQILARKPSVDDFGGTASEGCMEILCERRPDWIREIHAAYLDAGADAVETNSFGANAAVLADYGLAPRAEELNALAARLARDVAQSYDRPCFVVGSVGPGSKLVSLGQIDPDTLFSAYRAQVRGLLAGGADAILVETCQDPGQIKAALRAAKAAMAESGTRRPLWVQATVEPSGTLLLGTEIQAVLALVRALGADLLGLNCGTGPSEMRAPLAALAEAWPLLLSCQPNAGLPIHQDGALVYPLDPETFAEQVASLAEGFGLDLVGGCCGTTPDHIRALASRLPGLHPIRRHPRPEPAVSSLYQAVPLHQEPRPLLVGERTNANGSRTFRERLERDDFEGLVALAREQQREGAHVLDVCVACAGRDEGRDMETLVRRLATPCALPLMLDSTEPEVLERGLKAAPGRCIANSINLEDGGTRAKRVLGLCREYGAAAVALTLDEAGMARTAERKLAVADRLVALAVGECGFEPSDLILDPLTFTLGSGDEGSRRAALETLEAVRRLKARYPGVLTLLGVSNVSFGLKPSARRALNALMLHHAVQAGLDLAIFNAAQLMPIARIPEPQRQAAEDLIFDRRRPGHDPLKALLEACGEGRISEAAASPAPDPMERLRRDILDGDVLRAPVDVEAALALRDPRRILEEVLLKAMREVGEAFAAGETQLPFVLESAEAMRATVRRLEPLLPRHGGASKGRVVLATVKGDVHDIGKNLVEIILSNNGFEVVDLGIKQPPEAIAAAVEAAPTLAVGLSGLLVKSLAAMREVLLHLAGRGHALPVLLGGAALTRDYVERECAPIYPGPVLYASDAFAGLRHLEALRVGVPAEEPKAPARPDPEPAEAGLPLTPEGRSPWVRRPERIPEPPFWGVRGLKQEPRELFAFLDDFVVLRGRWAFTRGRLSPEAYAEVLKEKAEPLLDRWKARLMEEPLIRPRARYGYFPARASGNALRVFAPDRSQVLAEWVFPRQAAGERLCLADFFAPEGFDVLGLQLVTLGREAAESEARLFAEDRYADTFTFHGLATELTEAYAKLVHARIRRELGLGDRGARFSFGYPACPDLAGNGLLLELLGGAELGVAFTEGFQMVPEFTTCALVSGHPQARAFAIT